MHLAGNTTVTHATRFSITKFMPRHEGITKTTAALITKVLYISQPAVNIWSCSNLEM